MEIRTKIELTSLEIQNSNERTIQKCNQIAMIYNKDKGLKPLQSEVDFFTLQH